MRGGGGSGTGGGGAPISSVTYNLMAGFILGLSPPGDETCFNWFTLGSNFSMHGSGCQPWNNHIELQTLDSNPLIIKSKCMTHGDMEAFDGKNHQQMFLNFEETNHGFQADIFDCNHHYMGAIGHEPQPYQILTQNMTHDVLLTMLNPSGEVIGFVERGDFNDTFIEVRDVSGTVIWVAERSKVTPGVNCFIHTWDIRMAVDNEVDVSEISDIWNPVFITQLVSAKLLQELGFVDTCTILLFTMIVVTLVMVSVIAATCVFLVIKNKPKDDARLIF